MKRFATFLFSVILIGMLFTSCDPSVPPYDAGTSAVAPPSSPEETAASTEDVIRVINDRVSWIEEGLGGYPFQGDESLALGRFEYGKAEVYSDYYDGDSLVYRRGYEYYDKIEVDVAYYLYYNIEGRLIFAYIIQYRHPSYCIYFYNDTAIRLIQGERENEEETVVDEDMTHAVTLCLGNAYK